MTLPSSGTLFWCRRCGDLFRQHAPENDDRNATMSEPQSEDHLFVEGVELEWDDHGPQYTHPHPSPKHVMHTYRKHIFACKKRWGIARGLIHYRRLLDEYRGAKRLVVSLRGKR